MERPIIWYPIILPEFTQVGGGFPPAGRDEALRAKNSSAAAMSRCGREGTTCDEAAYELAQEGRIGLDSERNVA